MFPHQSLLKGNYYQSYKGDKCNSSEIVFEALKKFYSLLTTQNVFLYFCIANHTVSSSNSAFWKTHKGKLIPNWTRKTVWLLINNTNMKTFTRKKCRKMFLEVLFFAFQKTFFRKKFSLLSLSLLYTISLAYKISHCLSANHNPKLRCAICTAL